MDHHEQGLSKRSMDRFIVILYFYARYKHDPSIFLQAVLRSIAFLSFFSFFSLLAAQESGESAERGYYQDRIYIKLEQEGAKGEACSKLHALIDEVAADLRVRNCKDPFRSDISALKGVYRVRLDGEVDTALLKGLTDRASVDYAERVPRHRFFYTPNDLQATQWSLSQVNAQQAWNIEQGVDSIDIAIVDDAVRYSHEDLIGALDTNTAEVAGNGVDDDGNGYVDDRIGWDAANNDNDPSPPAWATNSQFTHGTHVAGIAAASTDNGKGMASLGFDVDYIPVKIAEDASGNLTSGLQGIEYAIAADADVINMSWGGGGFSTTYQNLIDAAHDSGIVMVAAAGNSNTSIPMYPASYNHVISVGATDQNDQKASFSNYGSDIDVMAPGVDIFSTLAGHDSAYGDLSGTSMASPLTAGLCGLMLSKDPLMHPDSLEKCLENTSVDISAQNPSYVGQLGAGRIDAHAALNCVKPIRALFKGDTTRICPGYDVQFTDQSYHNPTSWEWSFPGGTPNSSTAQNPTVTYSSTGTYDVKLIATNSQGSDTLLKSGYVTVAEPTGTLSGSQTISSPGNTAYLNVSLTGNPPWTITYTDGVDTFTVNNIGASPYFLPVSPTSTTTYELLTVEDAQCSGTASGTATVTLANEVDCPVDIEAYQKVSNYRGDFGGTLDYNDRFGISVDSIGDLDNDGVQDLVVGAKGTDDGGSDNGAVWILFLNTDGTVKAEQKISETAGGFSGNLGGDSWGFAVAGIGDLDNDGTEDIVVGEPRDDDGGSLAGSVWVLFLNSNGTVKSEQKIGNGSGGFSGTISGDSYFGCGVASMKDLDGDSVQDIVVGSRRNSDGGYRRGAAYVLFMNTNGTVASHQKISDTQGNLSANLQDNDYFGTDVDMLRDLNGDGVQDMVVGARWDDDGVTDAGASYILFMNSNGTVQGHQKISNTQGNFSGTLNNTDQFGRSVAAIGDLNGDGHDDISVTANKDDDGYNNAGATWILYLNGNGTVKDHWKISQTQSNFSGNLTPDGRFGTSVASIGDLNNDGVPDLYIGEQFADDGNQGGAVWYMDLNNICPCQEGGISYYRNSGEAGDDQGHSVIKAFEEGYYMVGGFTEHNSAGGKDFLLMKKDSLGNTVWTRTYGGSNDDIGASVALARSDNDSSYVLAGRTNSFGASNGDLYVFKVGPGGSVVWEERFESASLDEASDIFVEGDGDIVLAGSAGSGAGGRDGYLLKLDGGGNLKWENIVGTSGTDAFYAGSSLKDTAYVFVGSSTSHGSGSISSWIVRTDTSGNLVWERAITGSDNEEAIGIGKGLNGELLVTGYTTSFGVGKRDISLTSLDEDGTLNWFKTYGGVDHDAGVHIRKKDTSYYMSAWSQTFGSGSENLLLAELDSSGEVLSAASFGGSGTHTLSRWSSSFSILDNGGVVQTGYSNDGATQGDDLLFMRTNYCGKIGCYETSLSVGANEHVPNLSNPSSAENSGLTASTPSAAYDTIAFQEDTTCIQDLPTCDLVADFSADTVCIGDTTSFIDQSTDTSGANIIFREWRFGDGDTLQGVTDPDHLYASPDTFLVELKAATDDSFPCVDKIEKPVLVLDTLTTFTQPDDTICVGDSIHLGPLTTVCGAPPYSYSWTADSSLTNDTIPNPVAYPDSATTYTVTVTDDFGVTYTDTIKIHVDTSCCVSHPSFQVDSTYCRNDSVLITNNSVSTEGVPSYDWDFGPSSDPSSHTGTPPPKVAYDSSGIFTIRLILNDACGSDTAYEEVTIVPPPLVDAGNDTIFCLGDSVVLGDTSIAPIASYEHHWSPSYGLTNDSVANPIAFPDSGVQYVVEVTDVNTGCQNKDTVNLDTLSRPTPLELGPDSTLCQGDSLLLGASGYPVVDHQWQDGSADSSIWADSSGTYWVVDSNKCGTNSDSVQLTFDPPPMPDIGPDTSICYDDSLLLDASHPSASYLWQDGSTDSVLWADTAGTYWVQVTDPYCPSASDTVQIDTIPPPSVDLGNDTTFCYTDSLLLDASFPNSNYQWQDGSTDSVHVADTTGLYWVQVSNKCATDTDSVKVETPLPTSLDLGPDTAICYDDSLLLDASHPKASYLWQDGSTDSAIWADTAGTYWVEVTDPYCPSVTDTVQIDTIPPPSVELGNDTTVCYPDTLILDASFPNASYQWQDGSTDSVHFADTTGIYWVEVSNVCTTATDSVDVTMELAPTPDLGPDSTLCPGQTITYNASHSGASYLWQDGSTDSTYTADSAGNYWVEVTDPPCPGRRDSVELVDIVPPSPRLGNDTLICQREPLEFTIVSGPPDTVLWQDGTRAVSYEVAEPGTYTVYASNRCGSGSDTIEVETEDCSCQYTVPNVFTPNGDGKNDRFAVRSEHCGVKALRIYNRWGQMIYKQVNEEPSWDGRNPSGKQVPAGTYFYSVKIGEEKVQGQVTLMRDE